jgi:hypothetical protein
MSNRPLKPLRFNSLGSLCIVGYHTACAEIKGLKFSGLFAWLLWRGVYLSKLPGLERKVRVLTDWILELFFPRDSQWMAKVDHFPLIAGLIHLNSRNAGIALHFVFAFIIGASFGLLFQRDVRGYGSCLGWGLGYGTFWWFLGPMTIMPLWQGRSLDWSYYHGQELFGSLVGHIVYGLIVGVIYAAVIDFGLLFLSKAIRSIANQKHPVHARSDPSVGVRSPV